MTKPLHPAVFERQYDASLRYAEAEKSDPFAFRRALSHMRHGLTKPLQDGRDAHYDADSSFELRRTAHGEEYQVRVYHSRTRP